MNAHSLHANDLIGITKYRSHWQLFAGTVAEWILDYASYDPTFSPSRSEVVFRGNLLIVTEDNASGFLAAMEPYELCPEDLRAFFETANCCNWPLVVMVDFDARLYVNGFSEIPLHEYVPTGWKGVEGDPLEYIPDRFRSIWKLLSDRSPRL